MKVPQLYNKKLRNYGLISEESRRRYKGFEVLKEYQDYYLCGKFTKDGELLYRECFSKFDVDEKQNKQRRNK